MKGKHVVALALLAIATALAVFYLQTPGGQSEDQTASLVPGLDANINDVTQVRLLKAGNEPIATIKAAEQGWTVAERNGYPADTGKVRKLLIDLSKAGVIERKTSNPDLYHKLGVEDVSSKDAIGTQIEIEGLPEPVKIVLGDTATSLVATYARRVGEEGSLMVRGQMEPGTETSDWLDTELIDVPGDGIQAVRITRPDDDNIVARKTARGGNLEVANVPKGRELSSPTAASTLAAALSGLTLKDVIARSSLAAEADAGVSTEFRTFDGLVLTATSFKLDGKHYVTFDAAFDEDLAREFYVPPENQTKAADSSEEPDEASAEEATQQEIGSEVFDKTREEAARLQAKFADWAFELPEYKYNNLTKPLSDLLMAKEQ